ncbi:unnamed protein product [Clavelina lepadiformis]|uniref:G-protein coupled receptors family 1 profile domain-containing protein n=1 Tax=Clavelina lepadiformis TaxID=159417 RepID=A0ABP0EVV0_CLALP
MMPLLYTLILFHLYYRLLSYYYFRFSFLNFSIQIYAMYQIVGYTIFFYCSMLGVCGFCAAIIYTVRKRGKIQPFTKEQKKRRIRDKYAVIQLVLIIISFIVGYAPYTIYEFWSIQPHPKTQYYREVDYWFGMIEYFCLRFTECMNPVFYNIGSPKVRKYTKLFLRTHMKILRDVKCLQPGKTTSRPATSSTFDIRTVM